MMTTAETSYPTNSHLAWALEELADREAACRRKEPFAEAWLTQFDPFGGLSVKFTDEKLTAIGRVLRRPTN